MTRIDLSTRPATMEPADEIWPPSISRIGLSLDA
jgi:hypothetical protein